MNKRNQIAANAVKRGQECRPEISAGSRDKNCFARQRLNVLVVENVDRIAGLPRLITHFAGSKIQKVLYILSMAFAGIDKKLGP
jgi:hypothetical protein